MKWLREWLREWLHEDKHNHHWHEIPDSHRKVKSLDKPTCAREKDLDSIYRRPLGGIVVKLGERCCWCGEIRSHITIESDTELGLSYPPLEES